MSLLKTFCAAFCIAASMAGHAQTDIKIESFPVNKVRLTESAFKHAEDLDIQYLLALNPDRLLAPYLKGADLQPKAENYTNWENTGLDGHVGGHYVSALSYMYAATGNKEIKARLDYMISELKRAQDAAGDGYLCGAPNGRKIWKEISEGNIKASGFGLNGGWVPLYNIHKIYAGLRDAYCVAGIKQAKGMMLKLTQWMLNTTKNLSNEQIQDMLRSEHGGLNEVFADASALSGNEEYLNLAHRFSHEAILNPLLKQKDELTGKHANTQIPKVIGFKRIADLEDNKEWDEAARFFWETVVEHRSITIGGNSVREHFHPSSNFESMLTSEQGPETCNTYNMLRLTKMLYETSGDTKYMDYYERAMYNHILSTINPVQGGFVYFTPMRSGHYRVYSQPQTSFWCCVGSGLENHAKYGEMIYSHEGDDELYVNLFVPSTLQWGKTEVAQDTRFPEEEATTLVFNGSKDCEVKIRIPEWCDAHKMTMTINGTAVEAATDDGYLCVDRKWKKGDRLKVNLPMSLRAVQMPDDSKNYSFMYGPVVLAAKMGKQDQIGLFADDSRGGHIAGGKQLPLQDMPVIVEDGDDLLKHLKKVDNKPLTFKLTGVNPAKYNGMTLEPFNKLYECRYMVYWNVVSNQQLEAQQKEMERREQEKAALKAITADEVTCGEQQPESDHFIKYERCKTGMNNDLHWRMAEKNGWFQYTMKRNGRNLDAVVIVSDPNQRVADAVTLNGEKPASVSLAEGKTDTYVCMLPASVAQSENVVVKVSASDKQNSPKVYKVILRMKK